MPDCDKRLMLQCLFNLVDAGGGVPGESQCASETHSPTDTSCHPDL